MSFAFFNFDWELIFDDNKDKLVYAKNKKYYYVIAAEVPCFIEY